MFRTLAAAAALTLAAAAAHASPLGVWATEKNDEGNYLTVEIKPCDDKLCGYIVGAHARSGKPDASYQHLGKPMVTDMVANGENKWEDGEIWDPSKDERYNSKMELKGDVLTVEAELVQDLVGVLAEMGGRSLQLRRGPTEPGRRGGLGQPTVLDEGAAMHIVGMLGRFLR